MPPQTSRNRVRSLASIDHQSSTRNPRFGWNTPRSAYWPLPPNRLIVAPELSDVYPGRSVT
jgi:hypothetical protein